MAAITIVNDLHAFSNRPALETELLHQVLDSSATPTSLLVIAGDLTQYGQSACLANLAQLVARNGFVVCKGVDDGGELPDIHVVAPTGKRQAVVLAGNTDRRVPDDANAFVDNFGSSVYRWSTPEVAVLMVDTSDADCCERHLSAVEAWLAGGRPLRHLIVIAHHPPNSLPRHWSERVAAWPVPLGSAHWICGHIHRRSCYAYGAFAVHTAAGLDPIKAAGGPSFIRVELADDGPVIRNCMLELPRLPAAKLGGLSVGAAPSAKLDEALAVALREDWAALQVPGATILGDSAERALVRRYRDQKPEGILSVQLSQPDFDPDAAAWRNRAAIIDECRTALELGFDDVTVHLPEVDAAPLVEPNGEALQDAPAVRSMMELYATLAELAGEADATLSIGNLHNSRSLAARGINNVLSGHPQQLLSALKACRAAAGLSPTDRTTVRMIFDVGHAFHNPPLAEQYPIGRWFELLGEDIGALHVHQSTRREGGYVHQQPITEGNLQGPMINYAGVLSTLLQRNGRPMLLLCKVPELAGAVASVRALSGWVKAPGQQNGTVETA